MVEIIAVSAEDAKAAEQGGAHRIELVTALGEGGLTPSYGLIKEVLKAVRIPVQVMIRPHSKSFVYSSYDFAVMKEDIVKVKELGANGVVLGMLNEQQEVDEQGLEYLLTAAGDIEVTFHKAIDQVKNLPHAVGLLVKYSSIKRILTAGGKHAVEKNTEVVKQMVDSGAGRIQIMLGGGLTAKNAAGLVRATGVQEVHFGTAVRRYHAVEGEVQVEKVQDIIKKLAVMS